MPANRNRSTPQNSRFNTSRGFATNNVLTSGVQFGPRSGLGPVGSNLSRQSDKKLEELLVRGSIPLTPSGDNLLRKINNELGSRRR